MPGISPRAAPAATHPPTAPTHDTTPRVPALPTASRSPSPPRTKRAHGPLRALPPPTCSPRGRRPPTPTPPRRRRRRRVLRHQRARGHRCRRRRRRGRRRGRGNGCGRPQERDRAGRAMVAAASASASRLTPISSSDLTGSVTSPVAHLPFILSLTKLWAATSSPAARRRVGRLERGLELREELRGEVDEQAPTISWAAAERACPCRTPLRRTVLGSLLVGQVGVGLRGGGRGGRPHRRRRRHPEGGAHAR